MEIGKVAPYTYNAFLSLLALQRASSPEEEEEVKRSNGHDSDKDGDDAGDDAGDGGGGGGGGGGGDAADAGADAGGADKSSSSPDKEVRHLTIIFFSPTPFVRNVRFPERSVGFFFFLVAPGFFPPPNPSNFSASAETPPQIGFFFFFFANFSFVTCVVV